MLLFQQTAAQSGPHGVISRSREMHSTETIVANVIRSYTMSSVVLFGLVLFCAGPFAQLHAKLALYAIIDKCFGILSKISHTHAHSHTITLNLTSSSSVFFYPIKCHHKNSIPKQNKNKQLRKRTIFAKLINFS